MIGMDGVFELLGLFLIIDFYKYLILVYKGLY